LKENREDAVAERLNGKARVARRSGARLAAMVLSLSSAVGASGAFAQGAPGVTDHEIKLGAIWATSGPVRFVTEPMEQAFTAVFNEANANGGVHGRQIKWTVEDDGYQPARTLAGAKKLIERDEVFAISGQVGAPTGAAILPYVSRTKTPLLIIGAVPKPQPKNVFGVQASYADHIYPLTRQLLNGNSKIKLGYLYQNDDLGEIGRVGLMRALKEANAEAALVADVGYERGNTDFSTQVLRLRDAGAQAVIAMGTVGSVATAVKQAAAADYHPTWATYSIGGSAMRKLVGDLVEGMVFTTEAESEYSNTPGILNAARVVGKYFPNAKLDSNMILGYALAQLTVKGLEAAGQDLTQQKFIDAIESFGAYQSDVMPLSFSPEKHTGAAAIKIYQWRNGAAAPVSDWMPIGSGSP
jgi:ABC-type branched-subunit amino acid transport system substrate-binding protein